MIGFAVQLRSSVTRPAAAPSAAVLALAAQGKAPASWNRYAASLLQWETYAARAGTPGNRVALLVITLRLRALQSGLIL